MKPLYILGAVLLLGFLAISPASAIDFDSLEVVINPDGSASMEVQYSLSWIESIGVALNFANPAEEIKKAAEEFSPGLVTNVVSGNGFVSLDMERFATVANDVYTTPEMDFTRAEEVLKNYPLISSILEIDLSPTISTLLFPDGKTYNYYDLLVVPSVAHTLNT